GSGHHNQDRTLPGLGIEKGENLNGFAQSHVVGETAAEFKPANEMEPAQPVLLIITELSVKSGRWESALNAAEALEFVSHPLECRIEEYFRLARKQCVEESGLGASE